MTTSNLTRGQIERNLTQRLQSLYSQELGQRPERVICQFFDEKLAIVLENMITRSEAFLVSNERAEFAHEIRNQLDITMRPQIIALIEEVVGVNVNTILCDTDINNSVSGIIAILETLPAIRDVESIPKAKTSKKTSANNE